MINFRFHLVSLIAVFLALALGVLMGATVIDQAIVDGLRNRISNVREEANAQRDRNSELQDEVDRLQQFVGDEYGITDNLAGVTVAVIAPRGVEGDEARKTIDLLQTAGASAPGVLWLEEKLQLGDEDEEVRQELADILGVTSDGVDELRTATWNALAARPDLIPALIDAEFVEFDPVGDQGDGFDPATYTVAGARALLIDQSDAGTEANELLESVLTEFVSLGIPMVVGEVFQEEEEDGPARGDRLGFIRDDEQLVSVVSTVDDLELTEGKVTTVRALADLPDTVGHYGLGADADAALPPQ